MCSQINASVNSMESFFSFAKNNENMVCILDLKIVDDMSTFYCEL